jgi:hypothetical protein
MGFYSNTFLQGLDIPGNGPAGCPCDIHKPREGQLLVWCLLDPVWHFGTLELNKSWLGAGSQSLLHVYSELLCLLCLLDTLRKYGLLEIAQN